MALHFFDGFDAGDVALKGWSNAGNLASGNSSPSTRLATGRWASTNTLTKRALNSAVSQVFMGLALTASTIDTSIRPYISLWGDGGATQHLTVGWSSTQLTLRRGDQNGTVLGTYNGTFNVNQFRYLEVGATIADSGGTCTVKLDGVTVISYTGDTKNGGTNSTIDYVSVSPNGGLTVYFDDLYVCDDTGSAPLNTFLGDVRVQTLVPTGAGASTQWTPSTGSNWAAVDELPYSATDYVQSGTTGQRDTYAMSDLTGSPTVLAVNVNAVAKKTDASATSIKTALKSGSTVYYGTSTALSTNDATVTDLRTTDPSTSAAWTVAGVNAIEAGVEVA